VTHTAGIDRDQRWMRVALQEAALALGRSSPNPAVGCVLVRAGAEVARGHTARIGGPHAEAEALSAAAAAGKSVRGATAYVTLEPCSHFGRTPPCADALIAASVARVVVGCRDPHPLVAGRGLRKLRRSGVYVDVGVLASECQESLRGFFSVASSGLPFVHIKLAATLDGRIAARGGESRWISGVLSRRLVQTMRARADAVLVGIGTVLADDPRLSCRLAGAVQPLRVVLDPQLRTPLRARVVTGRGRALIVGSMSAPAARRRALERAGAEVWTMNSRGRPGWRRLLLRLAAAGVIEVLVEGGAAVAASAVRAGVVRRVSIFYNPRFMGGDGVPMLAGLGVGHPAAAPVLRTLRFGRVSQVDDVSPVQRVSQMKRVRQNQDDWLWEGEPL